MKEFINPEQGYSLVKCLVGETPIPEIWIEVPEGANFYCDKYFWMQLNSQKFWNGDNWQNDEKTLCNFSKSFDIPILWQREKESTMQEQLDYANELRDMGESGWSKEKHSHYKKDVSHLNMIDPYRIADIYDLHPCADHIMKKSLCAGNRGHKDMLRDIQDIIDTAERWKQMIEEDGNEI